MKKIIGFLPVWILYSIGNGLSELDEIYCTNIFYSISTWCMLKSCNIQDWSGIKGPWLKPTNLEIERRWIIKHLPILKFDETLAILQYYTPTGRYRVSCNVGTEISKYYHTVKKTVSYGVNEENEKEITKDEFIDAIKTATSKIAKSRRKYKCDGLVYEFDGLMLDPIDSVSTLYIMEIELNDINQTINMPYDIKKLIIKEITGDTAFSNLQLSTKI